MKLSTLKQPGIITIFLSGEEVAKYQLDNIYRQWLVSLAKNALDYSKSKQIEFMDVRTDSVIDAYSPILVLIPQKIVA